MTPSMAHMYMNRRVFIRVEKENKTKVLIYLWHNFKMYIIILYSPKLNTSLLVPFRLILPLYKPYNPLGFILALAGVLIGLETIRLPCDEATLLALVAVAIVVLFILFPAARRLAFNSLAFENIGKLF